MIIVNECVLLHPQDVTKSQIDLIIGYESKYLIANKACMRLSNIPPKFTGSYGQLVYHGILFTIEPTNEQLCMLKLLNVHLYPNDLIVTHATDSDRIYIDPIQLHKLTEMSIFGR